MKRLLFITIYITLTLASYAQTGIVKDFKPACDSIAALLQERTGVKGKVELKSVMKRKGNLDFYFTESLGDFPWYGSGPQWLRNTLKELLPEGYGKFRIGQIYSRRVPLKELVTPVLKSSGKPSEGALRVKEPSRSNTLVRELGGMEFDKGLSGRHIALWQSHGRYYSHGSDRWEWQRPCLFRTCEDMFTQGFVLPYLVPMLENAGAYVMLPRERDIQKNEVIADNDQTKGGRGRARYEEKGAWSNAGTGFADTKPTYRDLENPFTFGTARQAECIPHGKSGSYASVTWTPDIPERGRYAVYVSYKTVPGSTATAVYTVKHLGGTSRFVVNQKMGGGTWIYLGTFEFGQGEGGHVRLDNRTPEGYRHTSGIIVTADAVRFGGGFGNIERGHYEDTTFTKEEPCTSGLPRSAEAARYWLQWAGVDSTIYYQNNGLNDYKDDFMSRGDWVEWISRGSRMNPSKKQGLGIPVDLSLGFHTDAGVTPDDSLVGTLAIYTLKSERSRKLPDKEDRMTSRQMADIVQSQIVRDLRDGFDSLWTRRSIWDRGYRESRTPSSPSMLLELLSHQNFADMKYGLDPSFRFTASRAVYKGIVKYLSNRYGCSYAIQPLPVESVGIRLADDGAIISWKAVEDPLEPTASPKGFILQTRYDDGAFDKGRVLKDLTRDGDFYSIKVPMSKGQIYSFRLTAFNEGGQSFPSETVSAGIPLESSGRQSVLVVNNFDRVSGPAFIDTPGYAGFDSRRDSGVPYIEDITFIGEMNESRRGMQWRSNEGPGFGASYTDKAGDTVAGNTFDYASLHGKAIMQAGHPFFSCSNERFCSDSTYMQDAWAVDLICGKQVTTSIGSGQTQRYSVFPTEMQEALRAFAARGGHMLISGAYIGTDIWDQVFPVRTDSLFRAESQRFAEKVLGYRWITSNASPNGLIRPVRNPLLKSAMEISDVWNTPNGICYSVESQDGIAPASAGAYSIFRYADSGISAGTGYKAEGYRTICLGFPVETLKYKSDINEIIRLSLDFFKE